MDFNGQVAVSEYDSLNRLTRRTYDDGTAEAWTYDAGGRVTQTSLTTNGNTLTETGPSGTTTYTWDARNKLVEAHTPTDTLLCSYDIHGIRTSRGENGTFTHFVVDHNQQYAQVLAEVENGITVKQYTYGDDLLSQTEGVGEERFFLYDGLGTTRALTDVFGSVADEYFYEAFGNLLASTGNSDNDYRYTGEQYDAGLGQYYLRARYYDQGVGRFTQMDTWMGRSQEPATLHKYLYANGDPVDGKDPSGYMTLMENSKTIGAAGVLFGSGAFGTIRISTAVKPDGADASNWTPDLDGEITIHEALYWDRNGGGKDQSVPLTSLNLSAIKAGDFPISGRRSFNLLMPAYLRDFNDGLVYGGLTLELNTPSTVVKHNGYDVFNFDMKPVSSFGGFMRNVETYLGGVSAGRGTKFKIYLTGSAYVQP